MWLPLLPLKLSLTDNLDCLANRARHDQVSPRQSSKQVGSLQSFVHPVSIDEKRALTGQNLLHSSVSLPIWLVDYLVTAPCRESSLIMSAGQILIV